MPALHALAAIRYNGVALMVYGALSGALHSRPRMANPQLAAIGQVLRQERERQGLTLADAHNATKITPQNLDALEQDRFTVFPNRVYARAFLRDYANYLGLDSGPLLEQYEAQWGRPQQEGRARTSRPPDGPGALVKWVPVLIILIVVGLAASQPIITAVRRASRSAAVSKPDRPIDTLPIPKPRAMPVTPTPKPTPPEGVTLEARATAATWMRVTADGARRFEGIMLPGQRLTWHAQRKISFRTGNAGGISLIENGTPLPSLGKSGAVYEGTFVASPRGTTTP